MQNTEVLKSMMERKEREFTAWTDFLQGMTIYISEIQTYGANNQASKIS